MAHRNRPVIIRYHYQHPKRHSFLIANCWGEWKGEAITKKGANSGRQEIPRILRSEKAAVLDDDWVALELTSVILAVFQSRCPGPCDWMGTRLTITSHIHVSDGY
jgi:hypothetical protein